MLNFSIMSLDSEHIEEYCKDIENQVKSGVATMPLFSATLTPEGDPTIDKADICCSIYEKYKEKLDAAGIPSGILIQASIGHGWKLNQKSAFRKYTGLRDGVEDNVCCPLDKGFREYIRNSAARIAKSNPDHIMLDDDFRLISRPSRGCACPMHLQKLSELIGKDLTREQLWSIIDGEKTKEQKQVREAFIKTQIDSLIECVKEIRGGIDSVNPKIPGSFCLCGTAAEGAYEIASIMAGEGNPVVIRVNNANYCAENPRKFIKCLHKAAVQTSVLTGKPDVILAETDTCPQNRYSTPAAKLHSHFTFSILEGCSGAKHWITRLRSYEPKSGKAYRKKLETYNGFYHKLSSITPELEWLGCKIPVPYEPHYILASDDVSLDSCDGWCSHVLDRFGLPMHFSKSGDGVCFFDGQRDEYFTDEKIMEFLSGKIVLDAVSAQALIKRGFSEYLGVDVITRAPDAKNASGESFYPEGTSNAQYEVCELVPISENVKSYSEVYHLRDGKYKEPLFPGVTSYKNKLGGTVIVFSGNTCFPYKLPTAFGFLNETRKAQLVKILEDLDSLPIYYPDDAEVFLKAAKTKDGKLFVAVLDMSLDAIEDLPLVSKEKINKISRITGDGSYQNVEFERTGDRIELNLTAYPFDPVVLIIE